MTKQFSFNIYTFLTPDITYTIQIWFWSRVSCMLNCLYSSVKEHTHLYWKCRDGENLWAFDGYSINETGKGKKLKKKTRKTRKNKKPSMNFDINPFCWL